MLCGQIACGCSFQSAGLVISGSGGPGDPVVIEPAGPGIVADEDDVTSPFLGQTIYETTTGRFKVYDGTNWVIYGGNWPAVSLFDNADQTLTTNVGEQMDLAGEVYDTDGFHTGAGGVITVPAGLGGDYQLSASNQFDPNATGNRIITLAYASNTSVTGEAGQAFVSQIGHASNSHGMSVSDLVRLQAGATVTANILQNSGGDLDSISRRLRAVMIRHIPSL